MFVSPPIAFEGRLSAFIEGFVAPNLPPPDALCAWTDALLACLRRPDAICVVRGTRASSGRVIYGDNAAARWIFLRAWDGGASAASLADRLDRGDLPVSFAPAPGAYGRPFDPDDQRATASVGLKLCHVASALEGAPDDPVVRAARNLAPLNHFLFPAAERFAMTRVGWVEACPRPFDLGESPTALAAVAHRLRHHVGARGAPLLDRLYAAMAWTLPPPPPDPLISVVARPPERPPGPLHAASRWWPALLTHRDDGRRAAMLASADDADARCARLVADLTVERLVQRALALCLACDPRRLQATTDHPSEAAWAALEAPGAPLTGRWARAADALAPGGPAGLEAVRARDLAGVVDALRGVEAAVARRLP